MLSEHCSDLPCEGMRETPPVSGRNSPSTNHACPASAANRIGGVEVNTHLGGELRG